MILLELFCGTKSIGKVFERNGAEVFSLDFDPQHEPSLCIDILKFTTDMLPERFRKPDVIWASPPCTFFSVASIGHHWNADHTPKSKNALLGVQIVEKTLQIIRELKPKYWYMENPCGKLRKLPIVAGLHRKELTYCQYGDRRRKPTDIWTNNTTWQPKPKCGYGASCHEAAPRGSNTGTQGLKGKVVRAVIPEGLCEEIYQVSTGQYADRTAQQELFGGQND